MRTELLKRIIEDHPGYGAGEGTIESWEFKCPCGKGLVIESHDNIPGFREHDVWIQCSKCAERYELDISKGKRSWELIKKENK